MDGIGWWGGNRCQFFSFSILVIALLSWLLPVLWERKWGIDWMGVVGSWMGSSNELSGTGVLYCSMLHSSSGIELNMQQLLQLNSSDLYYVDCQLTKSTTRINTNRSEWMPHAPPKFETTSLLFHFQRIRMEALAKTFRSIGLDAKMVSALLKSGKKASMIWRWSIDG